jgi:WD40 repeat protein
MTASPDGTLLVVTFVSGIAKLIDPTNGQVLRQLDCEGSLSGCSFAGNSEYFAVCGSKGLFVYERDGNLAGVCDMRNGMSAVEHVNGGEMLVGSENGEIWRVVYDASARSFAWDKEYTRHGGKVTDIRYCDGLKKFASTSEDHVVLIHDI